MPDDAYTIEQLADMAAVSRHTIRSYVSKGLLPSSETKGPGAVYGSAAFDRLRVIRLLREETGYTLDQIRAVLLGLSEEQTHEWAESGVCPTSVRLPRPSAPGGSALEFIRSVRDPSVADPESHDIRVGAGPAIASSMSPAIADEPSERHAYADQIDRSDVGQSFGPETRSGMSPPEEDQSAYGRAATGLRRLLAGERVAARCKGDMLFRIEITPDIELNIRGPLTPEQQRSLCRLADHLRHLLMKGLP